MKIVSKFTALLLAITLLFTMATPAFAAKSTLPTTRAEYAQVLSEGGRPAITTAEFVQKISVVSDFFRLVTNGRFPSSEKLEVEFDDYLNSLNVYIVENSGFDAQAIIKSLPALNNGSTFICETFEIDPVEFRNQAYAQRDKFDAEGNGTMALICHLIGAYMSIISKCEVFAEPTDDPILYQLSVKVIYKDGYSEKLGTGILINSETGEIYGADGTGMLGIGFDFNVYDMTIYAVIDSWQRNFGFAVIYDKAADIIPFYTIDTRRYHFDYDGLEWMIQVWKGNYVFISTGAEVGIYNRVPGEELGTYYNCATDDQLMEMTLKITCGDTVILDLGPQKHWWINGFKLNGKIYEPEELTAEFSILMPNMEMLNAFVQGIENEEVGDSTYTVQGLKVTVVW